MADFDGENADTDTGQVHHERDTPNQWSRPSVSVTNAHLVQMPHMLSEDGWHRFERTPSEKI
jgi:hypothetical protein